jgi:hypothetical protein
MEKWKTLRSAFPTFPQGLPPETQREEERTQTEPERRAFGHHFLAAFGRIKPKPTHQFLVVATQQF